MFPFYKQIDAMGCGPTCLKMVAKHYGRSITHQSLKEKIQIGKQGANLLGISEAAEAIGFRTNSIKVNYLTLVEDVKLPAILHWRQKHFVVLYKIKKNKLFVADPAEGLYTLSPQEFKANWVSSFSKEEEAGIALLLEPTPSFFENEDEAEVKTEKARFKNIFYYIFPYKKLVYQLFIGLAIASILQLFLPFLAQSVVDTGVNTGNIHFVNIVLIAQLGLFAGRLVIEFVRGWILLHMSTRINIAILTDFLIKFMKLPVSYFDSKKTGDILQRMNDHKRIESFLTGSSLNVLFSVISLLILSVVLAFFNMGVFVVFAIASLLYAGWVILFLKKRKDLDYKTFSVAAREQSSTIQLVQGMQEIKLNGVERQMRWTWESLQAKLFRLRMKGLSLTQWQQAGAFLINEGKNIFITFLSAKAVIDGQMTLGTMLAIQYTIGQLNSPIEQMIGFAQSLQNAKISLDRINEIHKQEDEEPVEKFLQHELPASFARSINGGKINAGAEKIIEPNIRFENVNFTYPGAGNEPVLKSINLDIPTGKTTAIVGGSGSGKTTLLKLFLKIYQPEQGDIKLDTTSLSNISHRAWRAKCGAVMQESFMFNGSIASNIAVGVENPGINDLIYAAEMANIREFIESLPLGFNTKIGAEGTGLSMGQKQRIFIARAVYRDPDFILFDEATNSLDANNESTILKNLEVLFKGKTVIVVAHRLSTVKKADQIIFLNKGVITERGTHKELINLKGEYYNLVKNQLEIGN